MLRHSAINPNRAKDYPARREIAQTTGYCYDLVSATRQEMLLMNALFISTRLFTFAR